MLVLRFHCCRRVFMCVCVLVLVHFIKISFTIAFVLCVTHSHTSSCLRRFGQSLFGSVASIPLTFNPFVVFSFAYVQQQKSYHLFPNIILSLIWRRNNRFSCKWTKIKIWKFYVMTIFPMLYYTATTVANSELSSVVLHTNNNYFHYSPLILARSFSQLAVAGFRRFFFTSCVHTHEYLVV